MHAFRYSTAMHRPSHTFPHNYIVRLATIATLAGLFATTAPACSKSAETSAKNHDDAADPSPKNPAGPNDQKPDTEPEAADDASDEEADKSEGGENDEGAQEVGEDGTKSAEPQTDAEPDDVKPSGPSTAVLLKQVQSPKIADTKAQILLAEAERAGANAKDLALAANARGEALMSSPDRAESFFIWAEKKYDKHPLPSFNLAKLAAIRGEIPAVRNHLKTVQARGGTKLLQKVEFDPTFSLVHDDPEIRSMIRK